MNPARRRALRLLLAWGEPFLIPGVCGVCGEVRFVVTGHGVFSARVQARTRRKEGCSKASWTEAGGAARRVAGSGLRAACLPCLPPCRRLWSQGAARWEGCSRPLRALGRSGQEQRSGGSGGGGGCSACSLARSPRWAPLRRELERGRSLRLRWEPEGFLRLSCQEGGGRKDVFILAAQRRLEKKKAFLSQKVSLGCHLRIVRSYFPPGWVS